MGYIRCGYCYLECIDTSMVYTTLYNKPICKDCLTKRRKLIEAMTEAIDNLIIRGLFRDRLVKKEG